MLIEVTVAGMGIDPRNDVPILLLRDDAGKRMLPIWIGIAEATAIAATVEGLSFAAPMTHDLILSIVEKLGGEIVRVTISSVDETTFAAQVVLAVGDEEKNIVSRPSDAVALALKSSTAIFVDEDVFESGVAVVIDDEVFSDPGAPRGVDEAVQQSHAERWNILLEHLNDDDEEELEDGKIRPVD